MGRRNFRPRSVAFAAGISVLAFVGATLDAVSQELYVRLEAGLSAGRQPIVVGNTNLPDGTNLWVTFTSPTAPNAARRASLGLSICGDDGCRGYGPVDDPLKPAVVKHGAFAYGPVTDVGNDLKPGRYSLQIEVDTYPGIDGVDDNGHPLTGYMASQPPEVLRVLGKKGVNMVGPLVGACCFQIPEPVLTQRREEGRKRWQTRGAWIYYAKEVEVR